MYRVTFGDGRQWKVIKGNLVVARGEKMGTLYIVGQSGCEVNSIADELCSLILWNQRLGHMSEKGMKWLAYQGTIPELKTVGVDFCEPWVFGKQT